MSFYKNINNIVDIRMEDMFIIRNTRNMKDSPGAPPRIMDYPKDTLFRIIDIPQNSKVECFRNKIFTIGKYKLDKEKHCDCIFAKYSPKHNGYCMLNKIIDILVKQTSIHHCFTSACLLTGNDICFEEVSISHPRHN